MFNKKRNRRFQFSLSAIFVIVNLAAALALFYRWIQLDLVGVLESLAILLTTATIVFGAAFLMARRFASSGGSTSELVTPLLVVLPLYLAWVGSESLLGPLHWNWFVRLWRWNWYIDLFPVVLVIAYVAIFLHQRSFSPQRNEGSLCKSSTANIVTQQPVGWFRFGIRLSLACSVLLSLAMLAALAAFCTSQLQSELSRHFHLAVTDYLYYATSANAPLEQWDVGLFHFLMWPIWAILSLAAVESFHLRFVELEPFEAREGFARIGMLHAVAALMLAVESLNMYVMPFDSFSVEALDIRSYILGEQCLAIILNALLWATFLVIVTLTYLLCGSRFRDFFRITGWMYMVAIVVVLDLGLIVFFTFCATAI